MGQPPSAAQQQKVLDRLFMEINKVRESVQEAKENAAYAENLGKDLAREADHVVNLQLSRLGGFLLAADLLSWSMGYRVKFNEELTEIDKIIRAELPPT